MAAGEFIDKILGKFKGTDVEQKIRDHVRKKAINEAEKKSG